MQSTLLEKLIVTSSSPAFALIARRKSAGTELSVDVVSGRAVAFSKLEEISVTSNVSTSGSLLKYLVMIPYSQVHEVGFDYQDDGEALQAIEISQHEVLSVAETVARIPKVPVELRGIGFDLSDEAYAATAQKIMDDEIGRGEGSNFVLSRSLYAEIKGFSKAHALSLFSELLAKESGAYWTFMIWLEGRAFIGASPEQQITLSSGVATMNPISGTYRYPASGPQVDQALDFLNDPKETDELFMVADEELKMFGRFCETGGRLRGPYLKEMSKLAHTEYYIEGKTRAGASTLLRDTLLAPTVTGSPIKNACRVIAKYEPKGRGYYAGVTALLGVDEAGEEALDSAILIRTADIAPGGRLKISVGSTIVRHSDPMAEAAETTAKANGLLNAFLGAARNTIGDDARIQAALRERNNRVASFWLSGGTRLQSTGLARKRILVLDAEDDFTRMLAHQLQAMGLEPRLLPVSQWRDDYAQSDLVLLGPGPGNPLDDRDPRVDNLKKALASCFSDKTPFLAVCLSHQILAAYLGLKVERLPHPNQGVQREIDYFGHRAVVGFYNTFAARSSFDSFCTAGMSVNVARDVTTGQVHALRGEFFSSMQFHPESVLSLAGTSLLATELERIARVEADQHLSLAVSNSQVSSGHRERRTSA